MNLHKFLEALQHRLFWMKYGVFILRRSDLHARRVRIGGKVVDLSIPPGEEVQMDFEFESIFYHDCYGLSRIHSPVSTILDIGGNLGFFSLAARSHFPAARIHSYEPNPKVLPRITSNTKGFSIEVHPEAIGSEDGMIDMELGRGSLFSRAVDSPSGQIKKTAFRTAVERIGGSVDLLKIDCEGGEWELLADPELWKPVNRIAMEYHLSVSPNIDLVGLVKIIKSLGFRITQLSEAPELTCGFIQAERAEA